MIKPTRLFLLTFLLFSSLSAAAMSLDEAVSRARAESGGQVVSTSTREYRGQRVHIIRVLLQDGHVVRLRYPADKGRGRQQ